MPVNTILGLFASSPIKPLEKHITIAHKCTKRLMPFFEAVIDGDWDLASNIRDEISDFEHAADKLKREIRLNLPRGIFLPVERSDLLELITAQDKIANKAKDVAGIVLGRKLDIPEPLRADFIIFVQRCIDAAKQAKQAINELDELLETGFKGRELDLVDKMIRRVDKIEDDTDTQQIAIRAALLKVEKNYNPIDMIFLYKVIEGIGDIADHSERVAARLELMLSR